LKTQDSPENWREVGAQVSFSLVPWQPVLEKHIGQTVAGVARGNSISWEFGRKRGTVQVGLLAIACLLKKMSSVTWSMCSVFDARLVRRLKRASLSRMEAFED